MKVSDLLKKIKLSEIDSSDQTYYVLDSCSDTMSLALSIKQAGLITPVVLRPADNKYIIISGFNRVKACRLNQMETIDAMLVESGLDYIGCLSKAICAISFRRALTQPEIIKCIGLFSGHLNAGQIAEQAQAVFNTRLNDQIVSSMIRIGSLPDPCSELIQTGQLSIKSAKTLSNFTGSDLPVVLDIFSRIKASTSVQLEILTHLREVSKRDGLTMADLIERYQLNRLLDPDEEDLALKTRQFRTRIFEIRFPELSRAQKDKRMTLNKLKRGQTIKIEIPDNFENPDIHFSFTADSSDTFKKQVRNLENLACNPIFKEIFTHEG